MSSGDTSQGEKTILVVDLSADTAARVRDLIEFMDMPSVMTAAPGDWRSRLGERRLEALFIGPALSDEEVSGVMSELKAFDPNVPVVMMQGASQ